MNVHLELAIGSLVFSIAALLVAIKAAFDWPRRKYEGGCTLTFKHYEYYENRLKKMSDRAAALAQETH